MADLMGISACAIPSRRQAGYTYLRGLPPLFPKISQTLRNLLAAQITACSDPSKTPALISVALLAAGGGSTSIPPPEDLRAARPGETMQQKHLRTEMLMRSESLQRAMTAMPPLNTQMQHGTGEMPHN